MPSSQIQNFWSLEKDQGIKSFLILLQHEVGENKFIVDNSETLNVKAVRVIAPGTQNELSAYVYNYAQNEGLYGVDLEFPYLIATKADDQTIRLNNLTIEDTVQNVIQHLEL